MKTFITSDLHLNHKNILAYQPNRKHSSIEEMNESIIDTWNKTVGQNDRVILVGDFAMGPKEHHLGFLHRLVGKILLVPGNHDRWLKKVAKKGELPFGTEMADDIYAEKIAGQHFVFCHFPLDEWEGMSGHHGEADWRNALHCHGHCHGKRGIVTGPSRVDVGWDNFGRPIEIEEVIELLRSK